MRTPSLRFVHAACIIFSFLLICSARAEAVNAGAFLSGTVTDAGVPAANVQVTATGNSRTVTTRTDAKGNFSFPPLALGSYDVIAVSGDLRGRVRVDLGNGGAVVSLLLAPPSEIGHAAVSQAQSEIVHGSGTDVVLNSVALTQLPFNNNFSEMEIQMPGAVRGANGVVHINGDHGVIN